MPLLDIVQRACLKLKLPKPMSVATSTDPQIAQIVEIANEEMEDAARRHDWSVLKRAGLFTAGSGPTGVASFTWPADFGRMALDGGFFLPNRRAVPGPVSSRDWQDMTDGVAGLVGAYWRPYGAGVQIFGLSNGDKVQFDYLTNRLVLAASGVEQTIFAKDDDRPFLPERLVRLGIVWRWRQTKGFDYAEDLATYEREMESVTSFDTGPGSVMTAGWDDEAPLSTPTLRVIAP